MKVKLPKPVLGRILIKTIKENAEKIKKERMLKQYGLKDTCLELVVGEMNHITKQFELLDNNDNMPYRMGEIVYMAPDAFGELFQKKYGKDFGELPKVGDIIYYIPGQAYKVDIVNDEYLTLCDEDVVCHNYIEIEVSEEKEEVKSKEEVK